MNLPNSREISCTDKNTKITCNQITAHPKQILVVNLQDVITTPQAAVAVSYTARNYTPYNNTCTLASNNTEAKPCTIVDEVDGFLLSPM